MLLRALICAGLILSGVSFVHGAIDGTITEFVCKVDGEAKTPDEYDEVEYDAPATLFIGAECTVHVTTEETVQFYCTWQLHQKAHTLKDLWNPELDGPDIQSQVGFVQRNGASGDWHGSVKIEYLSGTERLLEDSRTVTFVEKVGQGGGGPIFQ